MKKDVKKHSTDLTLLIYIRYLLPIFASIVIFAMLFVPSYRFIFSGEVGDPMSTARLLSNSWEQARNVLFGVGEQTNMAISFSKILFTLIIILVVIFLLSVVVSIWTATVAFRCFFNKDSEKVERSRQILLVFIPNRIILSIFTVLSLSISCLPYLMKPIYWVTYSQAVSVVLEAPDSLIIGGVLVLAIIVLSCVCARIECKLEMNLFAKVEDSGELLAENNNQSDDIETLDDMSKDRIRSLFDNDKNNKK